MNNAHIDRLGNAQEFFRFIDNKEEGIVGHFDEYDQIVQGQYFKGGNKYTYNGHVNDSALQATARIFESISDHTVL